MTDTNAPATHKKAVPLVYTASVRIITHYHFIVFFLPCASFPLYFAENGIYSVLHRVM